MTHCYNRLRGLFFSHSIDWLPPSIDLVHFLIIFERCKWNNRLKHIYNRLTSITSWKIMKYCIPLQMHVFFIPFPNHCKLIMEVFQFMPIHPRGILWCKYRRIFQFIANWSNIFKQFICTFAKTLRNFTA